MQQNKAEIPGVVTITNELAAKLVNEAEELKWARAYLEAQHREFMRITPGEYSRAVATGRLLAMAIAIRDEVEFFGSLKAIPPQITKRYMQDVLTWADEAQKGGA